MSICHKSHRYHPFFSRLPDDQGGEGRHKCCGCAYNQGYQAGFTRSDQVWVNLSDLPDSQAGTVRHKSPQAAFAEGYRNGMRDSYKQVG
ncbi:hypothetical protein DFO54_111151 [Erwinia sp. AG740]|nr:hypothetical protein DFO54_111151 [Erwinia sp. AG740]